MKAKFQNTFIFLFAAILAIIIFIAVLFYRHSTDYQSSSQLVNHTQTVLQEAELISSLSKDLQMESAGFNFTGDSSFITRYNAAKTDISHRINTIRQLTADNASQQQRIDALTAFIHQLIIFSDASLTAKYSRELSASSINQNIFQRQRFREQIDSVLAGITKEEKSLLLLREADNERSNILIKDTFNALVLLIFALLTLVFLLTIIYFNKRTKAEEELRRSNAKFDMLVNNIKDFAIFMIDKDGIILDWYSSAKKIKGYTGEEIVGKPISVFYTEDDIKNGIPQRNLKRAAENGFFEEEGWRVRRDGSKFWADVVITAIHDEDGEVIGFTKVTRDFTLHKKAADEMRHALEMAKELNNMKSSFVSMASHEFRTPLTSILTSAILVEQYKHTDEQEKRERHIKKIRASVSTLTSILEEFLSLEKIESGKLQEKTQVFNLKEFTATICTDLKHSARPEQTITYYHTGKEEVNLDKGFMRHILSNLVSNAFKYSPENAHIEVFTNVADGRVRMMVKDNGIGISAEDQKHLFERFFRASNSGNIQGTGLGLHITKRYVDIMNGSITVNSEPGKGSEFIIELESKPLPQQ